jgi:hypothetical protein
MNKQKKYILFLSGGFLGSVMLLQFFHETYLERYIVLFTLVYFVVTQVINPRRRWLDVVGGILFICFSYIMITKLLEILPRILAS